MGEFNLLQDSSWILARHQGSPPWGSSGASCPPVFTSAWILTLAMSRHIGSLSLQGLGVTLLKPCMPQEPKWWL